jgi:hypothetical protein
LHSVGATVKQQPVGLQVPPAVLLPTPPTITEDIPVPTPIILLQIPPPINEYLSPTVLYNPFNIEEARPLTILHRPVPTNVLYSLAVFLVPLPINIVAFPDAVLQKPLPINWYKPPLITPQEEVPINELQLNERILLQFPPAINEPPTLHIELQQPPTIEDVPH